MKRLALVLIVLLTATSLLAGGAGKSCDTKHTKSVELTGTLARTGDGDDAKTVFRVADTGASYTVCEKTKRSVLDLSSDPNANLRIKGKVVSCGDGEELVIETAKKI
jgi:hypothetical protein